MFVHLTPETRVTRIRRSGIRRLRTAGKGFPGGIFAVPVTHGFYISHQWLRELKRRNSGPLAGVYFRIRDDERVWVGHYHQGHRWMAASEAVSEFTSADDAMDWEVVIPRRIEASEIHRIRRLPQVVGWRFSPESKGKPPFCTCKFCTRGEYGARRLRERLGSPDD
jgi:hypothetical protein